MKDMNRMETLLMIAGLFFFGLVILSTQSIFPWLHWGPEFMAPHITASEILYFILGLIFVLASELDWS